MKKGMLKKIARDYQAVLGPDWKRWRNEFIRVTGDWAQFVSFNASRFDDIYVPRTAVEWLPFPGPLLAGLLTRELLTERHQVQRWITQREHEEHLHEIASAMVGQFNPDLRKPLEEPDVLSLLATRQDYWPHVYVLCMVRAREGDHIAAGSHCQQLEELLSDRPYPWASERLREVSEALELAPSDLDGLLHATADEKKTSNRIG